MDVRIEKVGERNGQDRFRLVNAGSGAPITVQDNSEETIRKYFRGKGLSKGYLDECFQKARSRFSPSANGGVADPRAAHPAPKAAAKQPPTAAPAAAKAPANQPAAAPKAAAPKPANKPAPPAEDDDDLLFELGLEE